MKKIQKQFAISIVALCLTGFLLIIGVIASFGIRKVTGYNSVPINWFLQNLSLDLGFLSPMSRKYGDFDGPVEEYTFYAKKVKDTINDLCTICIPNSASIIKISEAYGDVVGMNTTLIQPYLEENAQVVDMASVNVVEFSQFCNENGIQFIYVQMPSKIRYHMVTGTENSYSGELTEEDIRHADMLVESLEAHDINVINLNDYNDLISRLEFDYTQHWSCENALEATNLLVSRLDKYGIIDGKDDGKQYYDILSPYTEDYLGYSYTLPIPVNSAYYNATIDEQDTIEGDFAGVFLKGEDTWNGEDNVKDAYHKLWIQTNFNLLNVVREGADADAKDIIFLGDSFSWPISAYLSQYVGRISSFNPTYFGGDVREYIISNKPDVVILALFDGQINQKIAYGIFPKLNGD